MMKKRNLCWLSALLLAVGGCKIDSLQDTIVVADVEDEFSIDYWEELTPGKRGLVFNLQTIKEAECLNATINYQFSLAGSRMNLSLDDILTPSDCVPGLAPIVENAKTGALSFPYYELSIDLKNTVVNKGTLSVNPDNYRISMLTEAGLNFINKKLNRIPDSTFWGYVLYPTGHQGVAAEWLASITPISAIVDAKEGYYGHFTINNNTPQKIFLRNEPQHAPFEAFYFQLTGSIPELKEKIAAFNNAHSALIELKVYTAWGEVL